MLIRFSELRGACVRERHGELGALVDLLIEAATWTVRYLVVNIDGSLRTQRVPISTAAVTGLNLDGQYINLNVTMSQVLQSPAVNWDQPFSRQDEQLLVDYYGWPVYWLGRIGESPDATRSIRAGDPESDSDDETFNLRCADEICGYAIAGQDGRAGYLRDLVIQLKSWKIAYATADPNCLPPRQSSLFSTKQINQIDWQARKVFVDLANPDSQGSDPQSLGHNSYLNDDPPSTQSFHPA